MPTQVKREIAKLDKRAGPNCELSTGDIPMFIDIRKFKIKGQKKKKYIYIYHAKNYQKGARVATGYVNNRKIDCKKICIYRNKEAL